MIPNMGNGTEWKNAARILKPFLQMDEIAKELKLELERLAGIQLERLGAPEAAEAALRKYSEKSQAPDAPLALASFLARNPPDDRGLDSALKLIRPLEEREISPIALSRAYVAIARAGRAQAQERAYITERLELLRNRCAGTPQVFLIDIALADLMLLGAEYDAAQRVYQEILGADPKNVVALANMAWLLSFDPQRRQEATRLVSQAIDIGGPLPALLDTSGLIYLNQGEITKALPLFQQALTETSGPEFWFHLAVAQARSDDLEEARKSFQLAKDNGFDLRTLYDIERGAYENELMILEKPIE